MELVRKGLGRLYWIALAVLVVYTLVAKQGEDTSKMLHFMASWLPPIGMLAIISAQLDLFSSIQRKNLVNIEARVYDFIHWLMLVTVNIGVWMREGVPIWWFILTIMLLTVIGAQIGVGLKNRWQFTASARSIAVVSGIAACMLGLGAGFARYVDDSSFGWGWLFETITAIAATIIVMRWIILDLTTIRAKAEGYPRTFFLKGIFSNALVFIFWVHVMAQEGFLDGRWWAENAGLTFNVLVGNLIYLGYYFTYEAYRATQQGAIASFRSSLKGFLRLPRL